MFSGSFFAIVFRFKAKKSQINTFQVQRKVKESLKPDGSFCGVLVQLGEAQKPEERLGVRDKKIEG